MEDVRLSLGCVVAVSKERGSYNVPIMESSITIGRLQRPPTYDYHQANAASWAGRCVGEEENEPLQCPAATQS